MKLLILAIYDCIVQITNLFFGINVIIPSLPYLS